MPCRAATPSTLSRICTRTSLCESNVMVRVWTRRPSVRVGKMRAISHFRPTYEEHFPRLTGLGLFYSLRHPDHLGGDVTFVLWCSLHASPLTRFASRTQALLVPSREALHRRFHYGGDGRSGCLLRTLGHALSSARRRASDALRSHPLPRPGLQQRSRHGFPERRPLRF